MTFSGFTFLRPSQRRVERSCDAVRRIVYRGVQRPCIRWGSVRSCAILRTIDPLPMSFQDGPEVVSKLSRILFVPQS